MTKHFHCNLLVCLMIVLSACSTDDPESEILIGSKSLTSLPPEEAYPHTQKEQVTFPNGLIVGKLDSLYILGGDIILTREQVEILGRNRTKSAVSHSAVKYWPRRKVYYTFAPGFSTEKAVRQAIAHWEANTCLRFYEKTAADKNYIEFFHGDGNYSKLGMIGGKQQISLHLDYSTSGTAIHEIGHAVGLFHEQSRYDRYKYITINWENIKEGKESNFETFSAEGLEGENIGPFDFNSIMLYGSFDFMNYRFPTIVKVDGSTYYAQRDSLSRGDVEGVKSIYGPPFPKMTTSLYQIVEDYRDYSTEKWEYQYDNMVYFYTDETYTVRTTLPYPRKLFVGYRAETDGQQGTGQSDSEVLVPAGASEYSLGITKNKGWYNYGVCMYYMYEDYYLNQ